MFKRNVMKDIGTILVASLFVVSGLQGLILNFEGFSTMIASKGFPAPMLVALGVLLLKIFGGLSLVFGDESHNAGKLKTFLHFGLLAFMIFATWMFHNAFENPKQLTQMLKNIAIIGALLLV